MVIHHLAWRSDWEKGLKEGCYRAASLDSEGFIHATKEKEMLVEVANLFFKAPAEDLLLVTLDEDKIGSPVKYEDPGVGHLFPHIYGPIDLRAVTSIETMVWTNGKWESP